MSFIERLSSLRRLKCTSIIEKGPQSVSLLFRVSIIRGSSGVRVGEKGGVSANGTHSLSLF